MLDAVVVGGGPNGLAAAITLAEAGRSVRLYEAHDTVGGGCRSADLVMPGVVHDVCSAVHPLARSSPFFNQLDLARHGLEWIDPPAALAHPLDDGSCMLVERSLDDTVRRFRDLGDAKAYRAWVSPLVRDWSRIVDSLFGPLRPTQLVTHPFALGRFGVSALLPASALARRFRSPQTRALLAGMAAHSLLPLSSPLSGAATSAMLTSAHAVGWPLARGGSGRIVEALLAELRLKSGLVETGVQVEALDDLPPHRVALLDLSPKAALRVAGGRLRGTYAAQLRRYAYGPGVYKIDLVLDGPIPWRNAEAGRAGTVHLGGHYEEIAASERAVNRGQFPERPFVLLGQPSLFDPSRAPAGQHAVWAYCHVPNGWPGDATEAILAQVERFAPGFRDRVLASHGMGPAELEAYSPNNVGGDIGGGRQHWAQFFTRPALKWDPYSTPDPRIFICSASTPPGAGVHGLCGNHAARSALRRKLR